MKEGTAIMVGVLIGLPIGMILGWLIANISGEKALVLSRSKETGEIEAIIPVRIK